MKYTISGKTTTYYLTVTVTGYMAYYWYRDGNKIVVTGVKWIR